MKILVLGESGQLARSLKKTQKNTNITYLGREVAPFENPEAVIDIIDKNIPTHVINTVAYTQVDLAEKEPDLCFMINAKTPAIVAKWCSERNINFYHYSTDYVFNGRGNNPWTEEDFSDPLNVYGKSKLEGEKMVLSCKNTTVFRTSWVYSEFGKNFVKTMLKLFEEKEELKIVCDQVGAPNYGADLAKATWDSLSLPHGLYHMSSRKYCSWYDFALKIKEYCEELNMNLKIKKIIPINSSEYITPALRPLNSRLNSEKLTGALGYALPDWDLSLNICMRELMKG